MIARADVLVDAEALAQHGFSGFLCLVDERLHTALLVEHAFGGRDDDLRSLLLRGQRLAQRVAHLGHVVGVVDLTHPFGAHALHGIDDGVIG
jgi:hypothetical protein